MNEKNYADNNNYPMDVTPDEIIEERRKRKEIIEQIIKMGEQLRENARSFKHTKKDTGLYFDFFDSCMIKKAFILKDFGLSEDKDEILKLTNEEAKRIHDVVILGRKEKPKEEPEKPKKVIEFPKNDYRGLIDEDGNDDRVMAVVDNMYDPANDGLLPYEVYDKLAESKNANPTRKEMEEAEKRFGRSR